MTRWGFAALLLALAAGNIAFAIVRAEPSGALVGLLAAFLALEEVARIAALSRLWLRGSGVAGALAAAGLWLASGTAFSGIGIAHLVLVAAFGVESVRLGRPRAAPAPDPPDPPLRNPLA